MLLKALVIDEKKSFVFLDRRAQRSSELIALKPGSGSAVKEIASIQGIVSQEFVDTAMQLVRPGLGDNQSLTTGPLAVFGAIRIRKEIKFADCVNTQQLLAGTSRCHIVFGRAGELHPVQQEKILLRPIPGHDE